MKDLAAKVLEACYLAFKPIWVRLAIIKLVEDQDPKGKLNDMEGNSYIKVGKPPQCVFPSASSYSDPGPSLNITQVGLPSQKMSYITNVNISNVKVQP